MKIQSISKQEVKRHRSNQYKLMVEDGATFSNWSTKHLPYSNKTIDMMLEESKEREENILSKLLNGNEEMD